MNCTSINDCPYLSKHVPTLRLELRMRLQNDLLVWCQDNRWHNELDLGGVHKPVYYTCHETALSGVPERLKDMVYTITTWS